MIDTLTGQGINVRHACRVLGVSESGYYAWKDRPDPPRALRRIWLAGEIADVHKASGGTYGYQRVTAELRYGREISVRSHDATLSAALIAIAIAVGAILLVSAASLATQQVFSVALYRYANGAPDTRGFAAADLEEPFRRRGGRS